MQKRETEVHTEIYSAEEKIRDNGRIGISQLSSKFKQSKNNQPQNSLQLTCWATPPPPPPSPSPQEAL